MAKRHTLNCCGLDEPKKIDGHPDHTKEIHRINRVAGQVEGVKRMVEGREYCPQIIIQIQAARAALKALESSILEKHLYSCVKDAFLSKNQKDRENKLNELLELFRKS